MKQLLVSVLTMLSAVGFVVAQNDGVNKQKYWKFRTDFRENYVKIGDELGESLPAGMRKPHECIDNVTQFGGQSFGEMHWGDGMIRHGHYLGLLATEYKLLKNSGKDVTGVLNELYFALKAFNRNDRRAEFEQGPLHGAAFPENLNGFFNREDVGEDFATDHWGDDPMRMRCTNSAFYWNNNVAKTHNLDDGYWSYGNSYQNVPSQDQVSSLLVGFSLVDKLVDNVWVQPPGETEGFYVVTETEAIVHRMVSYFASHNWFVIDVNGWPTNNGGADLILSALPILKIAERITGNSALTYNQVIKRRMVGWHKIYYCLTGLGINDELTPGEQATYCNALSGPQLIHITNYLDGAQVAGPLNNQNNSLFQSWQLNGNVILSIGGFYDFWHNLLPGTMSNIYSDWLDDHKYNNSTGTTFIIDDLPLIEFDEPLIKDYNATILFNLGVASNSFSDANVAVWANATQNRQVELINKILNNGSLSHDQGFYRSFMDNMGYEGAYHLREKVGNPGEPEFEYIKKNQIGGWGSEYRWTHPTESNGEYVGKTGLYSNLDYMLYHNLYWLAFNSGTQMTETSDQCPCGSTIIYTPTGNETAVQQGMIPGLNENLAFLPTCVPSALVPVFNLVTAPYTIQPKFSEYVDWSIFTTKYQLQNATIETGASLTVKTHLVLCDNTTVTVKPGAFFYVDKSYTQINVNAAIDVEGELRVRAGTELHVRGKLRIKNGGKLIIEDGAKLIIDYTGTLEYYNGALVQTIGASSSIEMKGVIKTMNATTFSILNTGGNTTTAKLYIDGPLAAFQAEVPAYFKLEGKGFADQFIVLRNVAQLKITDPEIISFRLADCSVLVNGGTSIRTERPFYSYTVNYTSAATNGGFTVAGSHIFNACHFVNVPVKVPNYAPGTASITFSASNCHFSSTSSSLNTTDNALLKVTGGGYAITNSYFKGARSFCIESSSMTVVSSISGTEFTNLSGTATGATLTGVQDVSNVELKMTNCILKKLQYGVNKSNGKLTLKCNYFGENNLSNIRAVAGCILNMSVNDFGGYNNIYKSLQNKCIEINNCTVNLKDGYNFIEACPSTITGSVAFSCSGASCVLDMAKNQWNSASSVPSTSQFQLISTNSNGILPFVSAVAAKPACGFYDGQIIVGPPRSTYDSDGMPIFYSSVYEDSVRLDVAIVNAMLQMTAYDDSSGNDLRALNRFNAIFTADLNVEDSLTSELLWFALPHMKTALESAFIHEQLQTENNATAFDSYVSMYANALTTMNPETIDSTNYIRQFYHEIDKAHLLRLIGHSDIGLNILTELESCGLDSIEQAHLNHWKQVFETDLVMEQLGMQALDSTIVIDTTGYLNPALVSNGYSFGAIINDLNSIQYPNCDFYTHRDLFAHQNGIQLFPNPSTEEVYIHWETTDVAGSGKLVIVQSDGRYVYNETTRFDESSRVINIYNWKPGTYIVTYTDPSGKVWMKRLVVQ